MAMTGHAAIDYSLNESFESGIPATWTQEVLSTTTQLWIADTLSTFPTGAADGNGRVAFRNMTGTTQGYVTRLITPAMNLSGVSSPVLTLAYAQPARANTNDQLKIYYRLTESSDWVLLKSYEDAKGSWTRDTIALIATSQGTAYQLAFEGNENGGFERGIVLDDVKVFPESQCSAAPEGLAVIPDATTAFISWTRINDGRTYEVVVSSEAITDFSDLSGALFHQSGISNRNVTATGLTAQNHYYAYIRSTCDDNESGYSAWSSAAEFDTPCEAIASLQEGFENMTTGFTSNAPECWNILNANTGTSSTYPQVYVNTKSDYVHAGSNSLYFVSSNTTYCYAILPALADVSNKQIEFYYKDESANSSGRLFIGYMTNIADESSFVQIEEFTRSTSWTKGTADFSMAPDGARIAFKYGGASNNYYLGIDDIVISNLPDCRKVSSLNVSNVAGTSAVINFGTFAAAQNYQVVVATEALTLSGDPTDAQLAKIVYNNSEITASGVSVEGLTSATAYYVYARALCGEEETGEWSNGKSFTTRCEMPWKESFEGITSGVPAGWDNSQGTTSTASYKWSSYSTGYNGRGLRFDSYTNSNGNTNTLVTPSVYLSENAILSFYWKNSVGGDAKLYVSQDGGTTKDEITTVNLVGVADWTLFEVDLTAYTGNFVTVYFASTSNWVSGDAYHYLDEVSIRKIPTCKDINSVVVSGISNNSAKVVFSNTAAANYQVIVATEAVADPESLDASKIIFNDATLTDTIAEVTDLTANTTYYAYVRGVCGSEDLGAWTNALAFTTSCDPITIASKDEPWIEDFNALSNGDFSGECWGNEHIAGSATSVFTVAAGTNGNTTKILQLPDMRAGNLTLLSLPPMSFEDANAYAFQLDIYRDAYSTYNANEGIRVYAANDMQCDTLTATLLGFLPREWKATGLNVPAESEAGWYSYEFIIPLQGETRIFLMGVSQYKSATKIDNLKVRKLPDCRDMGTVAAKAVKSHGATIEFPANGAAQYQIVMATESIDPTYVDSIDVPASIIYNQLVSATSNVIEDAAIFAANTDFYVYVRAYCGEDEQGKWSKEVSFHTLCEPYTIDEFGLEDFTDKDRINCWTLGFSTEGTSASYAYAKRDSSEAYGAYIRLSKENASDSYSDGAYVVTPELSIEDMAIYEVSFSAATTNNSATSNMKKLHVGVATDPSDPNTYQTLKTFTLDYAADSTAEKTYVVSLAGAEPDLDDNYPHYIFFMAAESNAHDSTNYVLIDNVSFSLLSSCAQVIESSVSNLSTSGARVSWENVEAGSYEVFVSDINSREPDTLIAISRQTVSTLYADFSGLEQNTAYFAYVRGICGEGDTAKWSNAIAFQTTIGIPYLEPFSATTLNEGWKVYSYQSYADSVNAANFSAPATYKWAITSSSVPTGMEGSIAQLNFPYASGNYYVYSWLVSPTIDLTGHEDDFIELTFKMAGSNVYTSGTIAVYVSNDGAQSFKKLATITAADLSASAADFTCKLTKFAGQKINLAFYVYQYYDYYGARVVSLDDVSVHTYEAVCMGVENLNVALNGMAIDASWEIEGTPMKTIVELSDDANFATFIDSVVVENAFTHQFSGLQLSKTYYVRAKQADCANAKWVVSAAIKTPIGVPYSESFDASSSIPSDWSKMSGAPASAFAGTAPTSTSSGWTISTSSTGLSANHAKINIWSSANNMWLVSPAIDMTSIQATDSVVFSFDFAYTDYNSSSNPDANSAQALLLLVSTDGGSTWSAANGYEWSHTDSIVANVSKTLGSIPTSGTTITLTDFARFAGHSIRFAFVATTTSGDNDFHIDNVSLKQIMADCDDPTELALVGGDRQIAVTWSGDEAKPSIIQWSKTGDFASLKADTIESGLAYTIESLDPATTYYVRVQQICAAGNTSFTSVLSAATDCETITEFPWNEDFSGFASGALANPCWKNQHTAGSTTSLFSISSESLYLPDMQTGNRTLLALPEMSISEADAFAFVLDVKRESSSKPQEGIVIYASHSDTIDASAVRLAHIIRAYSLGNDTVPAEAESGWYNYEFAIPMSGTVRILIEGISEYGNSTYMDNFKVYRLPSCRQVKGVAASEIGADSAVVSFQKTAAPQYQVVATIAAINPDTLDKVADTLIVFNQTVSEDTLVISALQPQTDYYVYVRGLCDDEDFGAWSAALKMKTACGAITAFPWTEGFENFATGSSSSAAPECWGLLYANDGSAPYIYVNTSSSYVKSGSKSLYFSSSNTRPGFVILPEMANVNNLSVKFSYKHESVSSSGRLFFGYMTDIADSSSFVLIEEFARSTSWQTVEATTEDIPDSVADIARLAIKYGHQSSNYYMGIDDIEVSVLPSCRNIKGLAVPEISSSSAKATWNPSNAGQYQVILANAEIAPSDVDSVSGIDAAKLVRIDTVADASFDYTALAPATDYYVYVRGLCDENEKGAWGSASFKTQCLVDVPYLMDFDDAEDRKVSYVSYGTSYMIPSCFNAIAGGSDYPARVYDESEENTSSTTYSYAYSGTTSLRIYSSSTAPQFVILPEMNQRTDTLALTFKARAMYESVSVSSGEKTVKSYASSSNAHALKIGTMVDPKDTASFQLIETVVLTETATTPSSMSDDPMGNNYWETFTVYLTGATGKYIAFASDFSATNYVWIDDVQVDFVPDCRVPAQINIVPGINTADVTWVGTAEGYELALGAQGFSLPAGADSIYTLDTAFLHIEELTANTAYDLYIRSACDEGLYSAWSKVASFRTDCDLITIVSGTPWTEGFEDYEGTAASGSGVVPNCWEATSTSTYIPHIANSGNYGYYVQTGTQALSFYGGGYNYAVLPAFSNPLNELQVSFYMRVENSSYGQLTLGYILANDSSMNTFTPIAQYANVTTMTLRETDLSAVPDTAARLVFRWYYSSQYSCCIDDITISVMPSCREIKSFAAKEITNSSAIVTWGALKAAQRYQVILANAAIVPGDIDGAGLDETKVVSIDTVDVNSAEFIGLNAQTTYYFYVRSFCEEDAMGDWSAAYNFTTDCDVTTSFPWKEDFEAYTSGTFSANCWINEHIAGSGSSTFSIYTSSNGGNSTKQLYLPDMYSGTLTKLVLPGMAIPEANAYGFSIDVYRNATGYAAEGIRVYASASAEIDENAIELAFISRNYAVANDTIPAENASGWYTYELPIPMSGDMHIIIRGENKYGAATYMDNFRVRLLPTCEKVTDVEASEITTSSATISFPTTNAANYHVIVASKALDLSKELSAADSAKIVYDDATLTDAIAEVNGLTANTLYYAYARGLCEDEDGEWSAGISFRTECGAFTLPYSQNFDNSSERKEIEGTSSYLPLCWNEGHVSTSNLMAISAYSSDEDYAFSGSYALDVNTTASNSAYAVLPLIETDGENGIELSFEARALYSSEGYDYDWGYYEDVYNYATSSYAHSIKVGLMSDPSDISTFSLVEEVKLTEIASTPSSVSDDPNGRAYWENHTVRLDAPAGKYIAFVSDFSKANRVWIDDIQAIEYNASCQGVNGIEVSNVSISGFDVAFHYNEASDNNSARIAVSATETLDMDNVLLLDTIDNDSVYSAVVALASGRPFYVFVQQFCGEDGTSAWEMAQIQTPYMVRYEPVFSSTTLPSDWNRYSGLMDQVLDGTTQLSSTTSGWSLTAADAIINSTHFRGDIYGGSFNYWVVTPTIDLTPNVGDGLLLSFEAGLTPYSSTYADKRNDGVDDRFAVLVTTDDGATWTKVAEWNNYATGDFVYNDVPEDGASYQLNLSNFAGEHVRIAFYGESTVSNADNYFHFGNIVLDKCVAKTYTDHVCSGDDYDGSQAAEPNPFVISADQYKIGLNVFSEFRPSTGAGDVDSMIILNLYVHDYFTTDLYATVCEGSHYGPDENGFEFDAEVGMNDKRKILTSSIGCDSIIILHITVNQAITVHIEDSVEQGKAYEWNGKEYYTEGTYQFTTESEVTGCDSTTVLHLSVYQKEEALHGVHAQDLLIAPNPVHVGEPIRVLNDFLAEDLKEARIEIYSTTGALYYVQHGADQPFILPAIEVSGMYYVRVLIDDQIYLSTLLVQ
jgi:hypothetical protein